MQLTTAERLHELLEAGGLRFNGSTVLQDWLGRRALLGGPRLGQVLRAVLELGLSRASRGSHIAETPSSVPLRRQGAGGAWPISLLAHLLDRRRRRGLRGV